MLRELTRYNSGRNTIASAIGYRLSKLWETTGLVHYLTTIMQDSKNTHNYTKNILNNAK